MSRENIVISDAYEKIKEEIQQLQLILAALTAERDDLKYHTCPELTARYAREIGEYEHRIKYQEIMIQEMKRRIEIARAALNREKTVSQETVDAQVEKEYEQFHQKVEEEYEKAQKAKEEQERREQQRRQYEQQWREKYGDRWEREHAGKGGDAGQQSGGEQEAGERRDENAGGADSGRGQKAAGGQQSAEGAENDHKQMPNPKEMFRKIVKKLHPDMNPDSTEREKELFNKAVKAYQDGDLVTLQEIYDEVFGDGGDAPADKEMSYNELVELRDKLKNRLEEVKEEIEDIKNSFPYTSKEFLDDEEAVAAKQKELEEQIHRYEKMWKRLTKTLADINKEMEELKRRQGGDS